jgi:hypothetical protein
MPRPPSATNAQVTQSRAFVLLADLDVYTARRSRNQTRDGHKKAQKAQKKEPEIFTRNQDFAG